MSDLAIRVEGPGKLYYIGVRELRLENQVRLVGSLSDGDLARIYQAADPMVFPVLSLKNDVKGFGIVLLESAAAGSQQ